MKLDSRKMMEKAIEEMRRSIDEPRSDGKASPKVGAVLVKPDGSLVTAHRGELREGDHAEYTLLERKSRDSKLDGSVLFATLEPCAPKARKAPKLGCAERIVLARIKEVWVGIEDPDPTVDRKGIKFLQDAGVEVRMFDRDLQEIIQSENEEFIRQARERAAEQETAVREVKLSPLEDVFPYIRLEDFSRDALEAYRSSAGIADASGSESFNRILVAQGILKWENGHFSPTGFGLILFAREPRNFMPQAALLGTLYFEDGTEELRNFEGPQALAPEQALQWLRDKLPNPIDRSTAQRTEKNAVYYQLVREGIVNALVHRDYGIAGGKCQLRVTPDRIEIWSPGPPVPPVTLEDLKSFNAPMLSRNPILHFVFSRMKLAEERGLGLQSMRNRATQADLPLPRYNLKDPYTILTLYRTAEAAVKSLPTEIQQSLTETERAGWAWLATNGSATSATYAEAMNVDGRTARRYLNRFGALGLIRKVGSGPATVYEVI